MAKKINFKSKKTWKNIGLGCLAGVLGIGAVMGVGALLNPEEDLTKTINPTYAVGGLNEQGRYLETESSIYTKEAFECQGIDVTLDFDSNVSYRIFFYDEDNDFVSATEKQTGNYDETTTPYDVKYARIVVTPNDDEKISIFEKNGYAKQLTIEVNKEQKFEKHNYYSINPAMIGKYYDFINKTEDIKESPTFYTSNWFDIKGGETLLVGCEDNVAGTQSIVFGFKTADGTLLLQEYEGKDYKLIYDCTGSGEMMWLELQVPTNAVSGVCYANDLTGTYQDFIIYVK